MGRPTSQNSTTHHHAIRQEHPSPETRTTNRRRSHLSPNSHVSHQHHPVGHVRAASIVYGLHTAEGLHHQPQAGGAASGRGDDNARQHRHACGGADDGAAELRQYHASESEGSAGNGSGAASASSIFRRRPRASQHGGVRDVSEGFPERPSSSPEEVFAGRVDGMCGIEVG